MSNKDKIPVEIRVFVEKKFQEIEFYLNTGQHKKAEKTIAEVEEVLRPFIESSDILSMAPIVLVGVLAIIMVLVMLWMTGFLSTKKKKFDVLRRG